MLITSTRYKSNTIKLALALVNLFGRKLKITTLQLENKILEILR